MTATSTAIQHRSDARHALQAAGDAALGGARYLLAPLREPRLALRRITGRTAHGCPASLLVAGQGTAVEQLARSILPEARDETTVGTAGMHRLTADLLRYGEDADLILARVPRLIGALHGSGSGRFLRLPEAVAMRVEVAELSERRRRYEAVRSCERRCRAHGLTWSASSEPAAFDQFYDAMYVPFARRQFGDLAIIRDRTALRRRFERGAVLWIERAGERLGGVIVEIDGRAARLLSLGTPLTPQEARRLGLLAAVRLAGADYAERLGLDWLDFGGCMPWLRDGALRSKHLWGATLTRKRWANREILAGWSRFTPAVADFLSLAPIVVAPSGRFAAVTVCVGDAPLAAERAATLARELHVAGLGQLVVAGSPGWQGTAADLEGTVVPSPRLVAAGPSDALRAATAAAVRVG